VPRVPLSGGAYQSRSVIGSAQRCINLFPESNPPEGDAPVPVTHYPTPGLRLLTAGQQTTICRCIYEATTGEAFRVVGDTVYAIATDWSETAIGSVSPLSLRTPVSMIDNGQVLLIVDGTPNGYVFDLTARTFGKVNDPAFYGADRVEYLDTYFVLNRPGTNQLYWSLSEVSYANLTGTITSPQTYAAFDPLDVAAKTGSPDNIATVVAVHGDLWLLGENVGTEIFTNTGAADSTFERQPGAFIEHGCAARYSAARQDVSVFWLSKDREGQGIIVRGAGYDLERISTHAIEAAIQAYSKIDDAIGYCFQQQGHAFYVITFPTADVTWAYELKTKQWHELAWSDQNGGLHRHRANCCAFAYGQNIVGDWQNGSLYALDPNVYTDVGQPIVRIRTFPHLLNDGKRCSYRTFIADMEVGTLSNAGLQLSDFDLDFASDFGPIVDTDPKISLRWSDTRGASYGNPVIRSLGSGGQYETSPAWWGLGLARDRVFELSWSAPVRTALNGAFVDITAHGT
jgi:hypothetical protein